jgi:hypothetical protein
MRVHFGAMVALFAIASATVTGANADPYRWCAEGIGDSGATNCYFVTLEQCRAAVSGAGAFCRPNTFYTGPDSPGGPRTRRR